MASWAWCGLTATWSCVPPNDEKGGLGVRKLACALTRGSLLPRRLFSLGTAAFLAKIHSLLKTGLFGHSMSSNPRAQRSRETVVRLTFAGICAVVFAVSPRTFGQSVDTSRLPPAVTRPVSFAKD